MTVLPQEMLDFFCALIARETGIQYSAVNAYSLENRLRELAKTLGFADVVALWAEVKGRGLRDVEKSMILDLATNNETSFFRDAEVFSFFKEEIVAKASAASMPLRIWSAACSTGQEPYSLAMILAEAQRPIAYQILATDFSKRVLQQARSGVYSQLEVQRGLPAQLLIKYFEQVEGAGVTASTFKIKAILGQKISFHQLNLLDAWSDKGPFQIVFCRNVLIYQDVDNKKKVIARMADVLLPGGYLVLGGAESLLGLSERFESVLFGRACVYRLKS